MEDARLQIAEPVDMIQADAADQEVQASRRRILTVIGVPALVAAGVFGLAAINNGGGDDELAFLDGRGSPEACLGKNSDVLGSQQSPVDVGPGNIATGVCIKSGNNMFDGTGHSGVLGNGLVEDCYQISGVGTQNVTVERVGDPSPECQEISHIDVIYNPDGSTTTIETTTTTTPDSTTTVETTTTTTPESTTTSEVTTTTTPEGTTTTSVVTTTTTTTLPNGTTTTLVTTTTTTTTPEGSTSTTSSTVHVPSTPAPAA